MQNSNLKVISAHQIAYNPWLGYIHKILLSDEFIIMDDVQFEKNSFINRNKILQQCSEVWLTIPIDTKDYKSKTIKDMQISNSLWKKKHLKSLKQAYIKAPFFDRVYPEIEKILNIDSSFLIDYTDRLLEFLIEYLDIDTKISYASKLNIKGKKQDYVLELIQKSGAKCFIFGSNGKNYVDKERFIQNGINIYFQEYNHPKYNQLCKEFHPYMGVYDILFNLDRENIKDKILEGNINKEEIKKRLCKEF